MTWRHSLHLPGREETPYLHGGKTEGEKRGRRNSLRWWEGHPVVRRRTKRMVFASSFARAVGNERDRSSLFDIHHQPAMQFTRTRNWKENQVPQWMAFLPMVSWATNFPTHLLPISRFPHTSMRPSPLPSFLPASVAYIGVEGIVPATSAATYFLSSTRWDGPSIVDTWFRDSHRVELDRREYLLRRVESQWRGPHTVALLMDAHVRHDGLATSRT